MIHFDLSFPRGLPHDSILWLLCCVAILSLASCQPSGPSPTAIHASTCGSENEARLPIPTERLRAEIERIAGLSPGGYTLTNICQLDTGQFVVKIMLAVGHEVAGPFQTPAFLVQPDGRVERVKEEGG